jgi:hypothetical protein
MPTYSITCWRGRAASAATSRPKLVCNLMMNSKFGRRARLRFHSRLSVTRAACLASRGARTNASVNEANTASTYDDGPTIGVGYGDAEDRQLPRLACSSRRCDPHRARCIACCSRIAGTRPTSAIAKAYGRKKKICPVRNAPHIGAPACSASSRRWRLVTMHQRCEGARARHWRPASDASDGELEPGSGGAKGSITVFLDADTSQHALMTMPQHA